MKSGRFAENFQESLLSLRHRIRSTEMSFGARAVALSSSAFAVSVLLGARVLLAASSMPPSFLDTLALGLAALPGLVSIVALLLALPRDRHLLKSVAGASPAALAVGIAVVIWSSGLAALDLYAGRGPYAILVGAIVSGLLLWNRPDILACLLLPANGAFVAFAFAFDGTLLGRSTEALFLSGVSCAMAVMIVLLVRENTAPSQERLRTLEAENKELWNLSFRDGLTGLYNRRFAGEIGATMFTRAPRYHEQLHVLMIDIDHFKMVNDKLGHAVGDIVLRDVAEIIRANVRSSDMAARYGGEEFILFVVRAEPELAQFIANRIRDGIAVHAFENVPWKVTVSIGVASIQPNDSLGGLVDRSDKFLYLSKHSGRNRVSGS